MKTPKRLLALALVFVMVFAMFGCSKDETKDSTESTKEAVVNSGSGEETQARSDYNNPTPLVVASEPFSKKFSSFYSETVYDGTVVDMCTLYLMVLDRLGSPIYHGIQGETHTYNGTDYLYTGPADIDAKYDVQSGQSIYTATLRKDLKFSDGTPVTARDILFYYYVCLDPSFVGRTTLTSIDIVGLQNWRTQTSDAVYEKYNDKVEKIKRDGRANGYMANEDYSEEMYNDYWNWIDEKWADTVAGIVEFCNNNYADDDHAADLGFATYDEIAANEGLRIAFAMVQWQFAKVDNGVLADKAGLFSWDLTTTVPTMEDFIAVTKQLYNNDPVDFFNVEQTGEESISITDYARNELISKYGPLDEEMAGQGITSIEGIEMLDDYSVRITVNGYSAPAIYSILGIPIVPMHYYGDATKWDPEHGKYGFDEGDLEHIKAMTEKPMGAGPYIFESFQDKVVTFKANPYYYKGQPKIPVVLFKETNSTDIATACILGEIDAGPMPADRKRFEEVQAANGNGELNGDTITTVLVDVNGYGYIGLNAATINVGGDPGSDASKALRKGFATILSVYRDVCYDSWYGSAASVIQYPISNSSWAAPQASDYDYKQAFSTDPEGNNIYNANMTPDEKYAAAKTAALAWFKAAGCTVENGKVVAVPEGVNKSYTCIIAGYGSGDHPSYNLLVMAKDALAELGFELIIDDPADPNKLWNVLNSGTAEMWCAAWNEDVDPDMYFTRHSRNIIGRGGTDQNKYSIDDPQLDQLIMDARISDDFAFRKATYKQCLDIIVDWAVEMPAYQRKDCTILSTKRINLNTVTPDITTYWGWMNDIQDLEMNP